MASGIARNVGFVVLFVFAVWLFGQFTGFEIGLWGTLVGSALLTVIANLIFGQFRRFKRAAR